METWWGSRSRSVEEPSNATELMLRSGRVAAAVVPPEESGRAEAGLRDLGARLEVALVLLAPYRRSPDDDLRRAYGAVHDAMGDLAAVLLRVSATRPTARPARPARRRRPSGGRS